MVRSTASSGAVPPAAGGTDTTPLKYNKSCAYMCMLWRFVLKPPSPPLDSQLLPQNFCLTTASDFLFSECQNYSRLQIFLSRDLSVIKSPTNPPRTPPVFGKSRHRPHERQESRKIDARSRDGVAGGNEERRGFGAAGLVTNCSVYCFVLLNR